MEAVLDARDVDVDDVAVLELLFTRNAVADHVVDRDAGGFFELGNRLFEVDDVNLVAGAKDVLTHLRVPETGLVTEMATSFKHFTHADHD